MPPRRKKRQGGHLDEWDAEAPPKGPTHIHPGVKHAEEHLEITGSTSSVNQILLGPSPTKPRKPSEFRRKAYQDEDFFMEEDVSGDEDELFPRLDAFDDDYEIAESEDDNDGDDLEDLPTAKDNPPEEGVPNIDPSPYETLWEEEEGMERNGLNAKRQKKDAQANPLAAFIGMIDTFVDELLRLEAPEPSRKRAECNSCHSTLEKTHFRCRDCPSTALWCQSCVVRVHSNTCLHRLELWNGEFYERRSLKSLGLRVQLGHTHGTACQNPERGPEDFVVIDSDGIHEVAIDYCGCHMKVGYVEQLLRARLFPASCTTPRTVATFRVLETFQMLSFTAKTSAFEFLAAIRRRTDNVKMINDRYREFLRMVHMWRHVRLMKRSGRGHDPEGVKNTKPGECAVLCPACPQVGINLPDDWRDSKMIWIYALFLAIDANFRLKRKNVSTDERDPGLNHGYAYIVAESPFRAHLLKYGNEIKDDKSTCNNHDAIKSASIRGGKGVAASGLGTCQCSRHDMKRPQGSGDLQLGERYVNMDYFFLATLAFFIPYLLVVSYDIACQWSKKLKERCIRYGSNPVADGDTQITFNIPKFHLPAHVQLCRDRYNFNYTRYVGRTDGEAPERGWSTSNDLAYSTREMGAGTRRDTLDDAYGDINWWKSAVIYLTLAERATEAIRNRADQVAAFEEFAGGIEEKYVKEWTGQVQRWEADSALPNPFESSGDEITEASVRSEMADEDSAAFEKGKFKDLPSDTTPSQFILQGIELEEAIRKHLIAIKALGPATKSVDRSRLVQAGNMLKRRFESWESTQRTHMPTVFPYRERGEGDVGTAPGAATQVKDIRLLLPSDIVDVEGVSVSMKLARYEFRVRVAQAHTSIRELRGLLLWRSQRIISKKKYSSGTAMMTRSNTLIAEISQKIRDSATWYRRVRDRLVKLGEVLKEKKWEETLKILKDRHLRSLTTFDVGYGDGKRKLAWIWNLHSSGEKASVAVRNELSSVERAPRAHRWQEECILLREEMRRVACSFRGLMGRKPGSSGAELYVEASDTSASRQARTIAAFPRLVEDEPQPTNLRKRSAHAHAHLIEPLLRMDKGNGVVVDGSVMVEGKGYIPKKKRDKASSKKGNKKDTKKGERQAKGRR
ncbi:hypothetical protein NMY22_g5739 [Coprinellus aureogranulatus]|nr:hypothetical protein NMY22_g5739 [Coprinellus aureogranulatus]